MKTLLPTVFALFTTVVFVKTNSTQKSYTIVQGASGIPGTSGIPGPYGRDGAKRERRETGPEEERGYRGDAGAQAFSNWKQCVWKGDDGRDFGLIKDCIFQKKHMDTSLRVFYSGVLQTHNCKACCKRWFFTFNGAECSGPLPIEGVIHISSIAQSRGGPLRVRHIEGYCQNIPKGGVRVGINVGNCAGYGNADARSGWNSVSRIVVEEVPAPQQ